MHHLTDIHIQNFRSCNNVTLSLGNCTPIVGYNNAGKSNIMASIEWLVAPRALGEDDFFDTTQPVIVEGAIEGLDDAMLDRLEAGHRKKIEPFILNGRMMLRRVQVEPGGGKAAAKLEVRNPTTAPEGEGAWQGPPTGIPQAIQALFPEPLFIGAMEDAAEDATKPKAGSTLGKLLAEFTTPLEQAHGAAIQATFDAVSRQLASDGAERVEELQRFDREASQAVADFFPGINLHLDIPVPEVKALFKQGTVKVSEQERGNIRDFTSLGHGAQRSIQMALIRYLAELKAEEGVKAQRRLLLIEEPELFLHPQAIEQVRQALQRLSGHGYQVIFATHSPVMVDRKALPYAHIVRKHPGSGETRIMPSVKEAVDAHVANPKSRVETLMELKNASGWLFSDRVLLVEGKTERRVLPTLYHAVTGRTLAEERISLVELDGSPALAQCLTILEALGIEAHGLTDFDYCLLLAGHAGFLEHDDEHLRECLRQIEAMQQEDDRILLTQDGRPRGPKGLERGMKAHEVVVAWAQREEAQPVARALHDKLKHHRIWLWPAGDIESHLGLTGKKNETYWGPFCAQLEVQPWHEVVDDDAIVGAFIDWFNRP
ncbi:AAA family ATPase [Halomonas sp. NO4]|uniref:ATP-dependent nuclease n=1 Tax=Halomonas sp. NO4 TaxID=2484813 RepID=UPI0013D059E3|nr:AAA family ATPase [Halomonas sp. NO4]